MGIHANNLVKFYNKEKVVNKTSITLKKNEIVGLLGPNGAGKTTTFNMIVGLVFPTKGDVKLNNQNITQLSMYERTQLGMGYLTQESSIFNKLTVEENILGVLEMVNREKGHSEILESLLTELNIEHIRNRKGYMLSGGEKRRVEIARTLVTQPEFMLLDEPFAGIDPLAVKEIQKIIKHLKNKGIGILITDHNVRETLKITDKAYIMHEGKILLSGTPEEIVKKELAKKYYLGDTFSLN